MPLINKIPKIGHRAVRILENNIFVVNKLPDLRWRILDTFDAITPKYASTHKPEEVKNWFKKINCKNIHETKWCDCGWKAEKNKI